jgi:iron complex transport system substrate-binding protein
MKRLQMLIPLLSLIVTACSQRTPIATTVATQIPITITDALGRQVTLKALPQRIVITGKALVMIVDAVYTFPEAPERIAGLGNAGQGTSNFISLIDTHYDEKSVLENNAGAEQIAALHPDLVILKSYLADSVGAPIDTLGIPVIYVDFETPEQYTRDLAILGEVFQDTARATELISYYQSKVDLVKQAVQAAVDKPRVLLLYYNNQDGNIAFNVPPMAWMQTQMVQIAGGEPVWVDDANLSNGWTQITLEQIAAWDADQIYIISYNANASDIVAGLKADPTWQALRAVKDNQMYAFPSDIYSWDQPDTRWILGLTWLAGRVHPELFPDLDIVTEAQTFYRSLYGLDNTFFEQNIRPTFKGDLP